MGDTSKIGLANILWRKGKHSACFKDNQCVHLRENLILKKCIFVRNSTPPNQMDFVDISMFLDLIIIDQINILLGLNCRSNALSTKFSE